MIKIVDMAEESWGDLNNPPETLVPYIATWFRNNLGSINNLIFTDYVIDRSTQEIISKSWYNKICNQPAPACNTPPCANDHHHCFTNREKDIFKKIFEVKFYGDQINKLLYAAQFDTIIEAEEGDSHVVRKLVKNDLAKTFLTLKKDAQTNLIYLTHLYKFSKGEAQQIVGDDFITFVPYVWIADYGPGYYF